MNTSYLKIRLKNWILLSFMISIQVFSLGQNEQEIIIPGIYSMPESQVQQTNVSPNTSKKTAKGSVREDLHRFMGYEVLPTRYFSLPYDVMMNSNLGIVFTDVGILLLLFLPILFLLPRGEIEEENSLKFLLSNLALMSLLVMMFVISISSTFLNKNNFETSEDGLNYLSKSSATGFFENLHQTISSYTLKIYGPIHDWFISISEGQDFIIYPSLILLFVFLFWLISNRIQTHSRTTKSFIYFLLTYMLFWWILGSGGPWYGILLFCVPYIFLVKGISFPEMVKGKPEEKAVQLFTNVKSGLFLVICFGWVLMAFVYRSTNYNPVDKDRSAHIYIPPITEYQVNNINEKQLLDNIASSYWEIKKIVNQEQESLVYRVGSSIQFFIKKNDTRVLNDTFLDSFNQLITKFKIKEKIIQALKASGFKYIILDLNLIANDLTPEKSLSKKFTQLLNTLYGNPYVELLVTNRSIKLNSTGEVVRAVFQDKGAIVENGNIALFKIK